MEKWPLPPVTTSNESAAWTVWFHPLPRPSTLWPPHGLIPRDPTQVVLRDGLFVRARPPPPGVRESFPLVGFVTRSPPPERAPSGLFRVFQPFTPHWFTEVDMRQTTIRAGFAEEVMPLESLVAAESLFARIAVGWLPGARQGRQTPRLGRCARMNPDETPAEAAPAHHPERGCAQ